MSMLTWTLPRLLLPRTQWIILRWTWIWCPCILYLIFRSIFYSSHGDQRRQEKWSELVLLFSSWPWSLKLWNVEGRRSSWWKLDERKLHRRAVIRDLLGTAKWILSRRRGIAILWFCEACFNVSICSRHCCRFVQIIMYKHWATKIYSVWHNMTVSYQ